MPINVPKLKSALTFVKDLPRLSGAVLTDGVNRANHMLGFSDKMGKIKGKAGVWVSNAGDVMIGTKMKLKDFLGMSDSRKAKYLESKEFSSISLDDIEVRIDSFSPDPEGALRRSEPAAAKLRSEVMHPDGRVKDPAKFDLMLSRAAKVTGIAVMAGVGGSLSAVALKTYGLLSQTRSGCFMVGPEGQTYKAHSDVCSCEEGNPNASMCCGQAPHLQCPDDEFIPDGPELWTCPGGEPVDGCVACGATEDPAKDWNLCTREEDIMDVIMGELAAVGKVFNDAGDVVDDVVESTKKSSKKAAIYIGIGVGVLVALSITGLVIRITRKRK